ncbi:uncharacterized protein EDB93DRAFT_1094753 [Suillus bovinus]|uniref:uncharacterized protein n=1 Tax=Suillus bovinus TaxID=48563 RepID=UPI001B86ADF6|nr:uncharacterized protein EDB93DRAFT_1094753 [Suillus bovinus]KAG2130667.1 hypothetical protein EDB93DRAFT_1094753 [Suillus bovinus]
MRSSVSSSVSSFQDAEPDNGETHDVAPALPQARRPSDSDSGESEKGLKRKLADRGTSQGPENLVPLPSAEPTKRPRDDTNKDDNPRESKRPSPPPEQKPAAAETSALKFGGFMAYAAAASPFAAVKGQNIFSGASSSTSKKLSVSPSPSPSPLPTNNAPTPSPFASFASSQWSVQQTPASTATKRTGFEAFISSASPFATAGVSALPSRPKSPLRASGKSALGRSRSPPRRAPLSMASAFSSYASGGVQALFAAPHPKRARAESPNGGSSRSSLERTSSTRLNVLDSAWNGSADESGSGEEDDDEENERPPSTFGERLRAGRDDEEDEPDEEKEREKLQEQDVITGEEDEETIHHVRAKLYALCPQNQWKERGTGLLKLNVRRSDGGGARLLMRKEAVYTVILNVTLFSGMKCFIAQDPRYIRLSVIEDGVTIHYNLRVSNAKIAQDLLEEIKSNIPA